MVIIILLIKVDFDRSSCKTRSRCTTAILMGVFYHALSRSIEIVELEHEMSHQPSV